MSTANLLIPIALGPRLEAQVDAEARETRPRVKRWIDARPVTSHEKDGQIREINRGRYSFRCTFPRIDYQPQARCCGVTIASGTYAVFFVRAQTIRLTAPKGWKWGQDPHGIYLTRRREIDEIRRYHVTGDDVLSGQRACRSAAVDHERVQIDLAKQQRKIERIRRSIKLSDVYVTLRDSLRSGNCLAGSESFARRINVDPKSCVPASRLMTLAKKIGGTTQRQVERAIAAAQDRAVEDAARGFCRI